MRYEVPQFIDVEERIVGPLTLAQFFYVAGGTGGAYVAFRFLPSIINIVVAVVLIGFGCAMAFVKINNRPFPVMLYAMLTYWGSNKMYLWSFDRATKPKPKKEIIEMKSERPKALTDQKLRDIAWGLDVHNR
jgi:hypothetical protein